MRQKKDGSSQRFGDRVDIAVPATLFVRGERFKGLVRNVAPRGVGFQLSSTDRKIEAATGTLYGVGGPVEVRVCWMKNDEVGLEFRAS